MLNLKNHDKILPPSRRLSINMMLKYQILWILCFFLSVVVSIMDKLLFILIYKW